MNETNQDIASAFEVGLVIGVTSPDEVVAWADSVVGNSEYPPAWVIPIALAQENDRLALLKLLRVVPKADDENMRWCLIAEAVMSALDLKASLLRTVSMGLSHCHLHESVAVELARIEARYEACDSGEADWQTVDDAFLEYLQESITRARLD